MRSIGVGGFLIPIVSIARRGDAAAGAALGLRAPRDAPGAASREVGCASRLPRRRTATTSSTASGRGSRGRSCAGRARYLIAAVGRACSRSPFRRLAPADAGLGRGDPAVPAVGARAERPRRARSGRARSRRRRSLVDTGPRGRRRRAGGAGGDRPARRASSRRDPEVAPSVLPPGRPLRRPDRALRAGDRRRRGTSTAGAGAGVRPPAARRADPGGALPGRRRASSPAAGRRRASTSSTRPTAPSRGSCSPCSCSRTCS